MSTGGRSVGMLLHRSLEHDSRVLREASALAEAGYDVTVLEFAPTGPNQPGLRRRSVMAQWTGRLPLRLRQALLMAAFVVAIVRLRPDVVHAHDVATLVPGLVGARLVGAPLVYDSHELSSGVAYRRGAFKRVVDGIERAGIRRASLVITVSGAIADRLQERYRLLRRPTVLRNVCGLRRPTPGERAGGLRRELGLDREPLVLHQGSAAPQRGCETLVRAMPGLAAHLAFMGTWDPRFGDRLASLAAQLGVADRVHFVPNVALDVLLAHTREADVGVSLFEPTCENYRLTLPNKVFEYIAAGVPIVASAVPEVERIVDEHGVGWTVDPTSIAAVAAALEAALAQRGDPSIRERVRTADAAFGWVGERNRLLGAYREVLRTR